MRAIAVAALSLALLALMWNRVVDSFVFQPGGGTDPRVIESMPGGESVFLDTEDGVRIHAAWLPAPGATRALLFLHGNAGNLFHRIPNALALTRLDTSVLLLDYRGYGLSEGTPTEAGAFSDARAGLAHLTGERGFAEERVALFGRSLGAAVAVDLARGRALAGMILESAFPSIADVMGPPISLFLRGRFDSTRKIAEVRAPLLFFHGDRDAIVGIGLGRRLYELAPEPKAFETLRGAGHNDTVEVGGRAYFERIGRFLDEVAPCSEVRR